jgi:membrane protein insertase Oxa1/YidC/SpoIIIJ
MILTEELHTILEVLTRPVVIIAYIILLLIFGIASLIAKAPASASKTAKRINELKNRLEKRKKQPAQQQEIIVEDVIE